MTIFLIFLLLLMPLYIYWYYARLKSMLASWAAANGFTILETRRKFFPPIGMMLTSSKEQTLIYVKVYDLSTHRIRSGWLRLGSYWLGVLNADAIEINWDDE